MYASAPQKRIVVAIILGGVVIAGAIIIRSRSQVMSVQSSGSPVVTAEPTRDPLPVTDSNHDGVPDWQEALLQTKPLLLSSTTSSSPDTGTSTLTDRFSREFFQQLIEEKSAGGFGQSSGQIASSAAAELVQQAQDPLITENDIVTSPDNSTTSLATYGVAVAQIIQDHSDVASINGIDVLTQAMRDQNPEELTPIDGLIAAYTDILDRTERLPVPSQLVKQHLDLLNSYQAVLNDLKAWRNVFNDPVLSLLRLKRYPDDALGLTNSVTALYTALVQRGATWPSGSVVYTFIRIPSQQQ